VLRRFTNPANLIRLRLNRLRNKKVNITSLGSCFSGFVVQRLLLRPGLNFAPRLNSVLHARSDVAVDLIKGIRPDIKLVESYLKQGNWGNNNEKVQVKGKEITFAEFLTNEILSRYEHGQEFAADTPDLVIVDSLHELITNAYNHREGGWKVIFGHITFEDKEIKDKFNRDFEYIGDLEAHETCENVLKVYEHFSSRNRNVKIVFMHFPLLPEYAPKKLFERDLKLRPFINELSGKIPKNRFSQIEIPVSQIVPLLDKTYPNYSFQVWNHFYEDTYDYFADAILKSLSLR